MVLMAMVMMFTMLKALVVLGHGRAFASRGYYQRANTLYLVEAALAQVQNEVHKDPTWTAGLSNLSLDSVNGSFIVQFHTGAGPIGPKDSINNLSGSASVDGPRGPLTVPPFCADIVVMAREENTTRLVEALIKKSGATLFPDGVTASNQVQMRGNVTIDGIQGMSSVNVVKAGIQSNLSGSISGVLTWSPINSGDKATISGDVCASSSSSSAINFGANPAAYSVGSFKTSQPQRALPSINVLTEISANSGNSAPSINAVGTTHLPSGKLYNSGDIVVNGDLDLANTTLYVSGNLTVKGTISGTGGLYVAGNTSFAGDSKIASNNPNGVALYSHGSVTLQGFKGSDYLDALAAQNATVQTTYTNVKTVLTALNGLMNNLTIGTQGINGTPDPAEFCMLEGLGDALGNATVPLNGYQGIPQGQLGNLANQLQTLTPGPTRDFMISKFQSLEELFRNGTAVPLSYGQIINQWNQGFYQPGFCDAVVSTQDTQSWPKLASMLRQISFDKLGTSYFQGVIFTNGYVYASNEVDVVGAIWCKSDGTQFPGQTPDGKTINPGDIFLDNGVHLTFDQELSKNLGGPSAGMGNPEVVVWLEN